MDTHAGRQTNDEQSRFLTREKCHALIKHARAVAQGGGETTLFVTDSSWTGNLRWGRNQITTTGDVRDNRIAVQRDVNGAKAQTTTNQIDAVHIEDSVRGAERYLKFYEELNDEHPTPVFIEQHLEPKIWSDATYRQDAQDRARIMRSVVEPTIKAGLFSAGYMQVSAHGWSSIDSQRTWYYPFTVAQYSVTVRDPQGTGSGWAGTDHTDWGKIDVERLSAIALDKCIRSRNPSRLEPGRYTAILEPQAVSELCARIFLETSALFDRELAEWGDPQQLKDTNSRPLQQYGGGAASRQASGMGKGNGLSRIGERIIDPRLTVSTDPMDPELGYAPFKAWTAYRPVTWIDKGVLTNLHYDRKYAVQRLGRNTGGMPMPESFRMSGAEQTSMEEMIATTKRGIVVTRFWGVTDASNSSILNPTVTGYTRDGLWLVEDGKITKPIKNFRFTQSVMFMLNNIEQVGVTQRVLSPSGGVFPIAVPALKVRDFNFISLSDAV